MLLIRALPEGDEEMNSEFDFYNIYGKGFNTNKSAITREMISQYLAAGILFPEEVRHAERILHRINTIEQKII